jgi:hypothetical protein
MAASSLSSLLALGWESEPRAAAKDRGLVYAGVPIPVVQTRSHGQERTTGDRIAVPDIYTERRPGIGPSARNCWPAITPSTAPVAPTIVYFNVGTNTLGLVIHVNGETLDANPKIVQGFIRGTQE